MDDFITQMRLKHPDPETMTDEEVQQVIHHLRTEIRNRADRVLPASVQPQSTRGMDSHDRLRWITEHPLTPQDDEPSTMADSEIVDVLIAAGRIPLAIRELTGTDRLGWITRMNMVDEEPPRSSRAHYPPLFRPEIRGTL